MSFLSYYSVNSQFSHFENVSEIPLAFHLDTSYFSSTWYWRWVQILSIKPKFMLVLKKLECYDFGCLVIFVYLLIQSNWNDDASLWVVLFTQIIPFYILNQTFKMITILLSIVLVNNLNYSFWMRYKIRLLYLKSTEMYYLFHSIWNMQRNHKQNHIQRMHKNVAYTVV